MGTSYFMLENFKTGVEVFEDIISKKPENVQWRLFLS